MRPPRLLAFGVLLPLSVSVALAQHTHQRPPRTYDLQNVAWKLSFDETLGTIEGDVTNTLVPLKAKTKEVRFDSDKLTIKQAFVNGKPAKFRMGKEHVMVALPKLSGPKDKLDIRLTYNGRPEAGIYFIPASRAFPAKTSVVYTQGEMIDTRSWIPTYDWPDDKATFDAFVKVPNNYLVVTNGKHIGTKTLANNMKLVQYRQAQPMSTYLISLVTGQYTRGEDGKYGNVPVYWNVPVGLEAMGKAAFGGTDKMVDVYSKITGFPYPYAKFEQSAVPDYMFGGMENITAVTQTITALFPPEAAPVASAEGLVLHELAHQWFGDTVTCPTWEHAWINEGWATFLPHFYTRHAHGQEDYDISRYDTINGGYFATMGENLPVVWTGFEEPIDEFRGSIYGGGATRMFWLMYNLGEDRFWKAVTNYLNEYKYKNVTTEQFFNSFSKSTGVNLDTFRKQWFYRSTMPQLTIRRAQGNLIITQKAPYFDLNLPIWFWTGTDWVKKRVHITGAEAKLPLGDLGTASFLVDPETYLAASFDYGDLVNAEGALALYRIAPNAGTKARIIDSMFGKLSAEQVEAIARAEKNVTLFLRLLPRFRNEAYFLELSHSDDARIVNTVAGLLGNPPMNGTTQSRLRELLEHKNVLVQQSAMRSLLNNIKDENLAAKAWSMPSYNDDFREIALSYYIRNDKDRAREMALGVLAKPDSEDLRRFCIQSLGGLKDKQGERRVYEALLKVAQERSFNAKRDAMNALATYGDKAAIPILQSQATNSLHYTRRAAKAAITALGG